MNILWLAPFSEKDELSAAVYAGGFAKVLSRRTSNYRLSRLEYLGYLARHGGGRDTRYQLTDSGHLRLNASKGEEVCPASENARSLQEVIAFLRVPARFRPSVGYCHGLLDSYQANVDHYLTAEERESLAGLAGYNSEGSGQSSVVLAWNSCRLAGCGLPVEQAEEFFKNTDAPLPEVSRNTLLLRNHAMAIDFLKTEGRPACDLLTLRNLRTQCSTSKEPMCRASWIP